MSVPGDLHRHRQAAYVSWGLGWASHSDHELHRHMRPQGFLI